MANEVKLLAFAESEAAGQSSYMEKLIEMPHLLPKDSIIVIDGFEFRVVYYLWSDQSEHIELCLKPEGSFRDKRRRSELIEKGWRPLY